MEDRLFFLISKLNYELKNAKTEAAGLWNKIYEVNYKNIGWGKRVNFYVDAIHTLANVVVNGRNSQNDIYSQMPVELDLDKWQMILNRSKDSAELWLLIHAHNVDHQLANLIRYRKVKFFEPYVPLTEVEYHRLKNIVDEAVMLKTKSERTHTPFNDCLNTT